MISDRTRLAVITVVTCVWAGNFVAGLVPQLDYEPDQAINGIFMVIVGAMFAISARNNGGPPAPPSGGASAQTPSDAPSSPATEAGGDGAA